MVPAGWKIDATTSGDLTGDGQADIAMVIRRADPAAVVRNDGLGSSELDTNPRRLLVFAREGGHFRLIATSGRLVPPAAIADSPCLEDPLAEGGIAVARGVLEVNLHYWQSCGSYGVTSITYKFRRESGRFRLTGFDRLEFMRSSGEGEEASFNFLTGRKAVRPFAIDAAKPPPWRWSRFVPQAHYLDTFDRGACPVADAKTLMC